MSYDRRGKASFSEFVRTSGQSYVFNFAIPFLIFFPSKNLLVEILLEKIRVVESFRGNSTQFSNSNSNPKKGNWVTLES